MVDTSWIDPQEARDLVMRGEALLVCAYPEDRVFNRMRLEGAIPSTEFARRLPGLPSDRGIIFY